MSITRLKHQLAYRELWAPKEEKAEALLRGTLFHSVMEAHYRGIQTFQREYGKHWVNETTAEDMFLAVAPLLYEEGTGQQTERQELVEWVFRGYVDLYGLDTGWEVVEVEKRLEEWLPTATGSRSTFKLAGTVDLLVRDRETGGLWIVDHKTCRQLPKQKDFDMEDQTGIYAFLLRRAGLDIRGAIYNHCRTEKLKTREMGADERFKRTYTVRTAKELEIMALEALELMREAYKPRKGDAPRTPDAERCGWKCGFTEPCLAGRKGRDMRGFLEDVGFEKKDHKPGPTFTSSK